MSLPAAITVSTVVPCDPERAWAAFTSPEAVMQWNFASADWHCPAARNDLRPGGQFCYRMAARDGSVGFDLEGEFVDVQAPRHLRYTLGPEREVVVDFEADGAHTRVRQTFTPETTHTLEQQRAGWQAILDQYRSYVAASVARGD